MITYVKESKLDKINPNFFTVCSVSKKEFDESVANCDILLPTNDLYIGRKEGSVGKKKFKKSYTKYLTKKNTNPEWGLYHIALALMNKTNVCLVCTDEEFELGYIQILAETIGEMYSVDCVPFKEAKETISDELESFSKKERKLIDEDPDDLSDKKKKLRKEIIKSVNKAIGSNIDGEGRENFRDQEARYAIDTFCVGLANGENPVFTLGEDGTVKNMNAENYTGKSKDLIEAIMAPKDDKNIGELVKDTLKELGVKYKKEKLKELGKEKLLAIIAQLYSVIIQYRADTDSDD